MRLTRLDLIPYGRFSEHTLHLRPDASLHVVVGANESGKTTTLSAIGDLLFGFGRDTSYGFLHDQRLLRVGGAFRLADGAELRVRRRKGNKETLLDDAGKPIPEDRLKRALGAIDRNAFESEFGLTARALREGGAALLRAGGGLAETLAAGSASLSALSRHREALEAEADALFSPRKSGAKPFYLALERYLAADRDLHAGVITANALENAEARRREALAKENDLKGQHDETGKALARRHRARRTQAKLARLHTLAREREALADLPAFAEDALADLRAALDADRGLGGELDRLAAEDAQDEAAIGALGIDAALIGQAEAVDALAHELGAVRKAEEDLPRRRESHRQAQRQLDDLARRLGLADHAALLAAAPTDAAGARARGLIDASRRVEDRLAEAYARRQTALAECERFRASRGAAATDPEPFRRRLAAYPEALAEAEALRRERADVDAEAGAIATEVATLDPHPGDIEALARTPLPDEASLAAAVVSDQSSSAALKAAEQGLASAQRAVEAAEAALARRQGAGAGATRADWEAARDCRERAFDRLEAALNGEASGRRERFQDLRALALAADATVELLLDGSERAVRLQAAREELVARRQDHARAEQEVAEAQRAREVARGAHRALWAASGLKAGEPGPMARWRARAAGLVARRHALQARRSRVAAAAEKTEAARVSLLGWLREAAAPSLDAATIEDAHREARAHLEVLENLWREARETQLKRERAEKDAHEAEVVLARQTEARRAQAAEWPAAMAGIGLDARVGLDEASAALAVWGQIPVLRQTLEETTHRIETMQADIANFEADVAAVLAAAAPNLAGGRGAETLVKLGSALAAARRAADERDRLTRAMAARAPVRRGLESRRKALEASLGRAAHALGAVNRDALAVTLARLEQRRALDAEVAGLHRELGEIGDGLDETRLRAEQAELDGAALAGEIEVLEQRQAQLLHEIGEAGAASREAGNALEKLTRGGDAVGAARERGEAGGELIDIAERWIVRQTAARLAARAIERHRAAAQDPLVERAGELFALATSNAFAGLGADYDETDRPILVARRATGERVRVEGLSEGARDQLFLSLRLALLERRAGEPLPFIGDDLLASFDDERAACALSMLASFGDQRQTILFTHHAHVADIARGLNRAAIEIVAM